MNKEIAIMNTVHYPNDVLDMFYKNTIAQIHVLGTQNYAIIPYNILTIPEYQRDTMSSARKINNLVRHWDNNLFDPLLVSNHPEEKRFAVIDGYHRIMAGIRKGFSSFDCRVLDLPADDRLQREADMFRMQTKTRESVTDRQAHKASIICGDEATITLDAAMKKYGIGLGGASRYKQKGNILMGYKWALIISGWGGNIIDDVFNVLCNAKWNLASNGLSDHALRSVAWCIKLHMDVYAQIMDMLPVYLRQISPRQFIADSYSAYPLRSASERVILHMEDVVCDMLGVARKYVPKTDSENLIRMPGIKAA